jgi:hypothetical protein
MVRLLAQQTGLLYPPGNIPGHNAAGRIKSMKNFSDTIGNRTCDLPVCSAVPQTTAPSRAAWLKNLQYVDLSYCGNKKKVMVQITPQKKDFFPHRAVPSSGPGPYYRSFAITLRHTTPGRTPLDEWPVRHTHTTITTDRHPCPRQDSDPQSHEANSCTNTP